MGAMRVAMTGSSGMIGTALRGSLAADGHEVLRLVRREPQGSGEVSWEPTRGHLDPQSLDGVDAVVNLAGANIGGHRWTRSYKRTLIASRANATRILSEAVAALDDPPRVLLSASAIGFYGTGHSWEVLDEDAPPGEKGFLAELCTAWEAAAAPAAAADIAVCHPRMGMVMTTSGGALARMLPLFRLGLGGPLGGGEQYWSHVSLVDVVRALRFLLETPGCAGPYNVTAPEPVTNAEFSRVLAHALHRPMLLPVPEFALRIRLGELADDVLASLRVVPRRLLEAGFRFEHPDARSVVAAALR